VLGPLFEVQMSKNCTPLWREAHVQVKMPDKLMAPDHLLKFRCRKMVRCCGAKHMCKSKCEKNEVLGPLFAVQMSKNCTPLWREAHLQVKILKA